MKNKKVCNKTRSRPGSLQFKGQGTEHTTVKWPIGNKFGYLCMGAIPFNQNVWFKFSATSMQYRMEQHHVFAIYTQIIIGKFSFRIQICSQMSKFLVERFAFRKRFRKSGNFPGKYCTNCRCFQSFLSFG